jgi:uncharacterized protein YndB with AHSA1/START domain
VEVPGTPEEVWQAIATGPGISSWFVPCELEGREGGAIAMRFGPGMDLAATITRWEPPHRFAAESRDQPDAPPVATEWIVEAASGGTCLVRVVHSWFASGDEWDAEFESREHGWPAFFRILRLYLTHFRGQTSSAIQVMAITESPVSAAWNSLTRALGLTGVREGQRAESPDGAPRLGGFVERAGSSEQPESLVRLEAPAPGLAHLIAIPMGGHTCLSVRLYFYGDRAAGAAAREEPAWQALIDAQVASSMAR